MSDQTIEKSGFEQFMEDPYGDETNNPYGSDEERKERNRRNNINACGKQWSHKIEFDGSKKTIVNKCKYHRHCDYCRCDKYDDEIQPRLSYAHNHMPLGDKLMFDHITERERPAMVKRLNRGQFDYYSFPQPDDTVIIIHNNPDEQGDELWDYGFDDHDHYNEDNGFDLNFYTILKNIPEGKRITGNLGIKQEPLPDEENFSGKGQQEEDEGEKTSIKVPHLYKRKLGEKDANHAYKKAVIDTQNIKVKTALDLEQAMFARINAMNKHLGDSAIVYFTWDAVTDKDLELWNNNPSNFTQENDNVRITTNRVVYSNYSDIEDNDTNHRRTNFDAMIDRSERGDGLDDMRAQAIEDYLRYHGT